MNRRHPRGTLISLGLLVLMWANACATFQPPNTNGPRANVPPYPIELSIEPETFEENNVAWRRLVQQSGVANVSDAKLNRVTATIESLPQNMSGAISLPLVGVGPTQSEEEIRESLRRFITNSQQLVGANPTQLSLVERSDEPSGLKLARYEQRPFRYPLRGDFGQLVIRFRADRRVVEISSTCIPNTDRLQNALLNLTAQVSREDSVSHLQGRTVAFTDASGHQQNFTIAPNAAVQVRELVVYAVASPQQSNAIEAHLAWEIGLPNGPVKTVYLDAVSDLVIAGF